MWNWRQISDMFLDLDGIRGISAASTAEANRRMRGAMLLQRPLYNIGDTRVLKMLLDAGYDPNGDCSELWSRANLHSLSRRPMRNFFWQSVRKAERERNPPEIVDKMANHFASPLHLAALTGNLGALEMLLAHGAKADTQMHVRRLTPLHLAAMGGHESCIDALLRHAPALVNLAALKDSKGRTPAFRAARRGYVEVAARLKRLERGVNDAAAIRPQTV